MPICLGSQVNRSLLKYVCVCVSVCGKRLLVYVCVCVYVWKALVEVCVRVCVCVESRHEAGRRHLDKPGPGVQNSKNLRQMTCELTFAMRSD